MQDVGVRQELRVPLQAFSEHPGISGTWLVA